jgi:hypothetical protein
MRTSIYRDKGTDRDYALKFIVNGHEYVLFLGGEFIETDYHELGSYETYINLTDNNTGYTLPQHVKCLNKIFNQLLSINEDYIQFLSNDYTNEKCTVYNKYEIEKFMEKLNDTVMENLPKNPVNVVIALIDILHTIERRFDCVCKCGFRHDNCGVIEFRMALCGIFRFRFNAESNALKKILIIDDTFNTINIERDNSQARINQITKVILKETIEQLENKDEQ